MRDVRRMTWAEAEIYLDQYRKEEEREMKLMKQLLKAGYVPWGRRG